MKNARTSLSFIVKTNKGYICDKNASGFYENSTNEFYRVANDAWFGNMLCNCNKVDKLGFTNNKEEATKFSYAYIGNRVQEIVDKIKFGYENMNKIELEAIQQEIKFNLNLSKE